MDYLAYPAALRTCLSCFLFFKRHFMQRGGIMKKKIESKEAPKAIGPYSQAIQANNFIFVSGQLPANPTTGKLVEHEIRVQSNQVLDNIGAVLKAANLTFVNVVRCDVFLKNMNDFAAFNEEYGKRFNLPNPPARQTIEVARLPMDALIEISCIAVIREVI